MDPGWPANPSNTLICILCKSAMPYHDNNPERFFRHLLADHSTYFNLNLLLEISLMQPHAVRDESQPVAGGVHSVADSVLDQVRVQPVKKERKASSSSVVEPDSTSSNSNILTSSENRAVQSSSNLEMQTIPGLPAPPPLQQRPSRSEGAERGGDIKAFLPAPTPLQRRPGRSAPGLPAPPAQIASASPALIQAPSQQPLYSQEQNAPVVKPPIYHNLQNPVKTLTIPGPSSIEFNPEDMGDFDLSFFINQITQPDPEPLTPSTFIPFESKPSPFLHQSRDPFLQDTKPYTPNMFTMTVPPDFSYLDPISFVKQEPKSKKKVTRQVTVNKNNQPVYTLPDNPNRHLVPEDLKMLIINQNPTRGIKFTYSQRMNTQMVVDEYVLKKKKGPYLTRGGRVVNWKCINDHCQYTAVTWDGQIQDTARQHNHPTQPELYAKKQARVKIKETMAQEVSPVNNVVMDVVTETNPEMRNMIGSIDALKQAARRYNRKLHKESQQQHVYPTDLLLDSSDMYVPASVYQNYEVVGELPADFKFAVEMSDQVGLYTEVSTVETAEEVPPVPVFKSEQVTMEEETREVVAVDASEQVGGASEHVIDASEHVIDASEHVIDASEDIIDASEHVIDASEQVIDASEQVAEPKEGDSEEQNVTSHATDRKVNVKDSDFEQGLLDYNKKVCETLHRDDIEELLEASPTKSDPLRDEFI